MNRSRTAIRRFRLALAALALVGLAGASAPAHSSAGRFSAAAPASSAASAAPAASLPAAVPLAQSGSSCDVYPIAINEQALMNNPTTGAPGPRPMPNPWVDVGGVPQASRFRVSFVAPNLNARFLSWTGNTSNSTLAAALAGGGTLGAGFVEGAPPATDPDAGRQVNGILEVGDWIRLFLYHNSGNAVAEALDPHVAQRTLMILPVYNEVSGTISATARTSQFIRVRLLGYSLYNNGYYLDLGLVAHLSPYACFQYQTPALAGQTVTITPSMPLSATLERRWDFGDGSPISTSLTPTHAYAQPGTYTVTLTLPRLVPFRAVGRIEVTRPLLPPQLFLPATLGDSAP